MGTMLNVVLMADAISSEIVSHYKLNGINILHVANENPNIKIKYISLSTTTYI